MTKGTKKRQLSWKQEASLEAIAIVLSVLFALFLNDWWQDRETRQSHMKTLILIQGELNENRAEIVEAMEYYDSIIPRIRELLNSNPTTDDYNEFMNVCCELKSVGSFRTAHETAMLTGLYSYLEPETAAQIVAPYLGLMELKPFRDASMIAIMTSDMSQPTEVLSRFLVFSASVRPSLDEMLELTQAAIEETNAVLDKE